MSQPIELHYRMTPEVQFHAAFGWMVRRPERGVSSFQPVHMALFLVVFFAVLADLQGWVTKGVSAGIVMGIGIMMVLNCLFGLLANARIKRLYSNSYVGIADIVAQFDAEGVRFQDPMTRAFYDWRSVEEVIAVKNASGLRLGASTLAIPDNALPDNMTPKEFRGILRGWITSKVGP